MYNILEYFLRFCLEYVHDGELFHPYTYIISKPLNYFQLHVAQKVYQQFWLFHFGPVQSLFGIKFKLTLVQSFFRNNFITLNTNA
jgi:hypothetical protein